MTAQPPVSRTSLTKFLYQLKQYNTNGIYHICQTQGKYAVQPVDPLEPYPCFLNPPYCLEYQSIHEPLPVNYNIRNELVS